MTKPLEPYHYVWLGSHPDRTEAWLRERLADGFHVHHVNGNHEDNDPDNLALMEGVDHLRLHGMELKTLIQRPKKTKGYAQKPMKEKIIFTGARVGRIRKVGGGKIVVNTTENTYFR